VKRLKHHFIKQGKRVKRLMGWNISFCILNRTGKYYNTPELTIRYLFSRVENLRSIKADRMPIGIYYGEKKTFTNYEIN